MLTSGTSLPLMKRYFTWVEFDSGSPVVTIRSAHLPFLDRTDAVGHAPDLGGIDGHGFEGFVVRQTEGDGGGGLIGQVAENSLLKVPKANLTPAL